MASELEQLYWHCWCGINEPAQEGYGIGDCEPCIYCYDTAHVVTIKEAAAWEQARALGMPFSLADFRARSKEAKGD